MFATATVVEIDNRFTRQRFKLLIRKPRGRLLRELREAVAQADAETGDTALLDGLPLDACVLVDPWGAIRVVIYPGETTGTAARLPGVESELELLLEEARQDRRLVELLAENLPRFMDRGGFTIEALAELAGIDSERLAAILAKRIPAAFADEVCSLAECLGTTVEALICPAANQGEEKWN